MEHNLCAVVNVRSDRNRWISLEAIDSAESHTSRTYAPGKLFGVTNTSDTDAEPFTISSIETKAFTRVRRATCRLARVFEQFEIIQGTKCRGMRGRRRAGNIESGDIHCIHRWIRRRYLIV